MARLSPPRSAQYPLTTEFIFSATDTCLDINGNLVDFGQTNLGPSTIVVCQLPPNAVVLSGMVVGNEPFDTTGFDISVGTPDDLDRYLIANDKKSPGYAALTPTGYEHATGDPVTFTFQTDDACTTGRATIRIVYAVVGRANESQ